MGHGGDQEEAPVGFADSCKCWIQRCRPCLHSCRWRSRSKCTAAAIPIMIMDPSATVEKAKARRSCPDFCAICCAFSATLIASGAGGTWGAGRMTATVAPRRDDVSQKLQSVVPGIDTAGSTPATTRDAEMVLCRIRAITLSQVNRIAFAAIKANLIRIRLLPLARVRIAFLWPSK
jgi:hypothetical protein